MIGFTGKSGESAGHKSSLAGQVLAPQSESGAWPFDLHWCLSSLVAHGEQGPVRLEPD